MNEKIKHYLGIDIGGTAVKLGLFTEAGEVCHTESYSVCFDGYETPILKTVIKSIEEFLWDAVVKPEDLEAIGVSATGAIQTYEGIVAGTAGHIKNWEGSKIKEELEHCFQRPVFVLNDANAAALGELWLGAARGKSNVVTLTIGTGVGGGIIVNSRILLGADGFAGELGHSIIQCEGEPCSCGNRGCLEHYGSTSALVRQVQDKIRSREISGISPEEVDGKRIFAEIRSGNAAMKDVLDHWISYIAAGVVGLIHIFNPEMVLIGGGVSAQKELFVDKLRKEVLERAMPHFTEHLEIKAAELTNEAGMAGAVCYCIQEMQSNKL